jgi:hypothetical protein
MVAERPCIDGGLSGKTEYFFVDEDIGGLHLVHLVWTTGYIRWVTLNFTINTYF